MTGLLLRAAGLTAIYLLVLTSVKPGDVLVGAAIGLAVAVALRPRSRTGRRGTTLAGPGALAAVLGQTLAEMVRGTWRTVRFCLGADGADGAGCASGFVEIPRDGRTRGDLATWGVLTGESPDEIPVHVDEDDDVLVVHLLDARDPDAVRAHHARTNARWRGERR